MNRLECVVSNANRPSERSKRGNVVELFKLQRLGGFYVSMEFIFLLFGSPKLSPFYSKDYLWILQKNILKVKIIEQLGEQRKIPFNLLFDSIESENNRRTF